MKYNKLITTLVAISLFSSFILSGCSSNSETEEPNVAYDPSGNYNSDLDVVVPKYQKKLDLIMHPAYRDADIFDIPAGSTFSIVGKTSSSSFWTEIESGAKQAISDLNTKLGYTGKDKLSLSFSTPKTDYNLEEQINIFDEELDRYPLAVGLSPIDVNGFMMQLDLAAENGIPIIAFDSNLTQENISTNVGTDSQASILTAITELCQTIDNSGQIMLITDSENNASLDAQTTYIQEYLATNYPDINLVSTLDLSNQDSIKEMLFAETTLEPTDAESTLESTDADTLSPTPGASDITTPDTDMDSVNTPTLDTSSSNTIDNIQIEDLTEEEIIFYALERYPEVNGFITMSSKSCTSLLNTLDSRSANYDDFSIISYDANNDQQEALSNDKIDGLILQNPFGMGYATIIACARSAQSLGNQGFINTGYTFVTKDNLETDEIQELLY